LPDGHIRLAVAVDIGRHRQVATPTPLHAGAALVYTLSESAELVGIDPHADLLHALAAAIAKPGAITYPENLLTPRPEQVRPSLRRATTRAGQALTGCGEDLQSSPAIQQVCERIELVAATDFTVLVEGASGPQPHPDFIEVFWSGCPRRWGGRGKLRGIDWMRAKKFCCSASFTLSDDGSLAP
jgi:hypothetical protein